MKFRDRTLLLLALLLTLSACRTSAKTPTFNRYEPINRSNPSPPVPPSNPAEPTTAASEASTPGPLTAAPETSVPVSVETPPVGSSGPETEVASNSGTGVNNGAGPTGSYLSCTGIEEKTAIFVIRGTAAVTFIQGSLQRTSGSKSFRCEEPETIQTVVPGQPKLIWSCRDISDDNNPQAVKANEYSTGLITAEVTKLSDAMGEVLLLNCTRPQ